MNPMVKKIWENSIICALGMLFRTSHSNLLVFCAEHTAKYAVSLTAPVIAYIYTASANITPAARDDLHGDICSLLPRERADMEAGGYICEVCTHSSFVTVHNFTLTQHVTQSVFHSVVVSLSLSLPPPSLSFSLSLSLSLIHTLIHTLTISQLHCLLGTHAT